jgi:hypothetical protein
MGGTELAASSGIDEPTPRTRLMTRNMGTADRVVRTVVAIALGVLIAAGYITGTWAVVAAVVAVAFLVTSAVSFCPGYWPFGLSTRGRSDETAR